MIWITLFRQNGGLMSDFVEYAVSCLDDRFMLLDIGCSLGIASHWRRFGEHLTSYGFDHNLHEIARLQRIERWPSVHYIAGVIKAPPDQRFPDVAPVISRNPWDRLAVAATIDLRAPEIASL